MQLHNYIKSVLSLSSGAIIAQAISLFSMPIISRLYSQEEFGEYSLFVQYASLASIFILLRKEYALQLMNNEDKIFFSLKKISTASYSIIVCLLILTIINKNTILDEVFFVLLAGFLLVLIGLNSSFMIFVKKYFSVGISETINKSIYFIVAFTSIYFFGFKGLILGFILGLFAKLLYLTVSHPSTIKTLQPSSEDRRVVRNAGYAISVTHIFIAISTIVPMLTINNFYTSSELGLYSLALSIIFLPNTILTISIGNVYFENLIKNKSEAIKLILKTLVLTIPLSLLIFSPFIFFGQEIFSLVFGESWEQSGKMAGILSIAAMVGFVTGTIDRTCLVCKINSHGPIWSFFRMLAAFAIASYSILFNLEINVFIIISSISMAFLYIIDFTLQIFYALRLQKNSLNT
jgi:O-antigen/teichoic acid export membrane protein